MVCDVRAKKGSTVFTVKGLNFGKAKIENFNSLFDDFFFTFSLLAFIFLRCSDLSKTQARKS